MFMDVEASHKGRWSFTQDRVFDINDPSSYPSSFSGNIGTGVATPCAGIRRSTSRTRGSRPTT